MIFFSRTSIIYHRLVYRRACDSRRAANGEISWRRVRSIDSLAREEAVWAGPHSSWAHHPPNHRAHCCPRTDYLSNHGHRALAGDTRDNFCGGFHRVVLNCCGLQRCYVPIQRKPSRVRVWHSLRSNCESWAIYVSCAVANIVERVPLWMLKIRIAVQIRANKYRCCIYVYPLSRHVCCM